VRRPHPSESLVANALRRLARLLLVAVAGTSLVSLAIGLLAGSSAGRSLSVGFYVTGCAALVAGFALAVRGPVRLAAGERHGFRVIPPDERDDAVADSALIVVLGVALLVLGVLLDPRYPLF
jgi:hypothetical protein